MPFLKNEKGFGLSGIINVSESLTFLPAPKTKLGAEGIFLEGKFISRRTCLVSVHSQLPSAQSNP